MPGMLASALFTRGECCGVRKEKERKKKRGREREMPTTDLMLIALMHWSGGSGAND